MILFIKGFIIGLGKIIPGVSGSLLAIRLNVYEKLIDSVNNLFLDIKNNTLYLLKLGLGIISAIVLGSNLISYFLDNFYIITKLIFLLLIVSGIPMVVKSSSNYKLSFISFIIYIVLLYIPSISILNNYFFIGFIEAITTIVPGISGTAIFMSLGLYDEILSLFSNIFKFPIKDIIPFTLGLIIGGIIIIRFIDYCFKKYKDNTYSVILGLLIGSIVLMIIKI